MPLLVMVAGPNGSGKSTLIAALRSDPVIGPNLPALYVNADDIQREQGVDSATAQRAAAELRKRALAERRDVMYETVMSHPGKLAELQEARTGGYEVHVFFLATEDPSINVQRVAMRVAAGGHDVPEDRTRRRYERTLALAPAAIALADRAFIFDNSIAGRGIGHQAQLVDGRLALTTDGAATWVRELIARVDERAEDLAQVQARAGELGCDLQAARLDAGKTEGVIEIRGKHYIGQRVSRNTLVLHDASLLPRTGVEPHRPFVIEYVQGVGRLEARQATDASGRR